MDENAESLQSTTRTIPQEAVLNKASLTENGRDGMIELHHLDKVAQTGNSSMLSHALRWASAGWRVFPLVPGGKKPLTAHGFYEATTDEAIITGWWTTWPNANIGIRTGDGVAVLDVDVKHCKDGWKALADVGITREYLTSLNTFTVTTPSGGNHYWFIADECMGSGTDVLGTGSGVDVRSTGGYAVVPPSCRPEGIYTVASCGTACEDENQFPSLSKLANWSALGGRIHRPVPPPPPPRPSVPITDEEMKRRIGRAKAYLARCEGAVSGHGGHDRTFSVTSLLVNGFMLSPEIALDLLLKEYNPRCVPPWSENELTHKVESAMKAGPPEGKAYGWLLELDVVTGGPEDGALPLVEMPEQDDAQDESGSTEEGVEAVPLPPGPVGDFAKLIVAMSRYPFMPFATLGSLVAFATVASRKFRYENLYPSLYGAMLAASSNGKEDAQWPVEEALLGAGLDRAHVISRMTSYNAAIEQLMHIWYHPVLFAGVDEGAGFLDAARKGEYGLKDFLKEVWSKCGRWQHPWRRKKNGGTVNLQSIYHPALNILLAAQPDAMGLASDFTEIQDGLLPRCIWVVRTDWATKPNKAAPKHSQDLSCTPEGEAIVRRLKEIWNKMTPEPFAPTKRFCTMAEATAFYQTDFPTEVGDGEKDGLWPKPVQVGAPEEVQTLFDAFEAECRLKATPGRGKQAMLAGLWGKGTENAKRVALTLAVARFGKRGPFQINAEEARWGIRFVRAAIYSGIHWGAGHLFQNSFQAQCETVFGIIRDSGQGIQRQMLTRRLQHQYRAKDIQEAIETLAGEGKIEAVRILTKGRTALGWRAKGGKR